MINKATLEVTGNIPSKKNSWKVRFNPGGKGKGMYIPEDVRLKLNEIQAQLVNQWHGGGKDIARASTDWREKCKDCGAYVMYVDGRGFRACPKCKPMRPKLRHPNLVFRLATTRHDQDRDNQAQTILDCMVSAGILEDDAIRDCNGWMVIAPATKPKRVDEGCVVNLHWEDQPIGCEETS